MLSRRQFPLLIFMISLFVTAFLSRWAHHRVSMCQLMATTGLVALVPPIGSMQWCGKTVNSSRWDRIDPLLLLSNGVEWTSQVKDTNTYAMSSIVLNGSHFIGVGRYGRLMTSPDFEQWTTRHSQTISNLSSVVWTGSFAIASGEGGVILRSVDGLSWNQVPVLTSQSNHRLVWTGSTVFSVGSSGVYQSTDGMEWVQISTTILNFDDVTWTGTQFVGVGFNGAIFTSPTGVEWMQRASGTTAVLNAVKSAGGRIMAGGQGNTILQSTNGSDWTSIPFPNGTIEAIDYRFGKWIVATVAGIYSSVDGSAWQPFSGVSQGWSRFIRGRWFGMETHFSPPGSMPAQATGITGPDFRSIPLHRPTRLLARVRQAG